MLEIREAPGARVRIPHVPPGTALAIGHYGTQTRAFVVHPADFARLQRLDALMERAAGMDPLEFSTLAAELHRSSEAPEELDLGELGAALGLR